MGRSRTGPAVLSRGGHGPARGMLGLLRRNWRARLSAWTGMMGAASVHQRLKNGSERPSTSWNSANAFLVRSRRLSHIIWILEQTCLANGFYALNQLQSSAHCLLRLGGGHSAVLVVERPLLCLVERFVVMPNLRTVGRLRWYTQRRKKRIQLQRGIKNFAESACLGFFLSI